jgi:cytoskeletal protein CcmA (bactofilin family)
VSCLTEFKCAVYADGELPEEEAREVTRHVASCGVCRRLVGSLRFERTQLIQCLQDVELIEFELEDEVLSAPEAHGVTVVRFAAFVLAMAGLLRPVFDAVSKFRIPLSATARFNLLLDGMIYGIPSAVDSFKSFLNIASWVVVSCIALIAVFILFRRSPVISTMLSVLTILTVFSPWTYAIDVRRGEKPVTVPAGETIDDTLLVAGESSVDVEGTVNGDLIALARNVRVKGTVKGNLISFAERTEIDGTVEGSVLGTGGFVEVRGKIAQNLYGLAGSIAVTENSRIDGNATMFAGEALLDGAVGKDFRLYSAGSMRLGNGRTIQILPHANVVQNLFVKVGEKDNALIDPAARVGGQKKIEFVPAPPSRFATASFYVWQTIWLAAAFLTGLILLAAVPAFRNIRLDTGRDLLIAGGMGLVAAVVPPVAAVIAGLTLVGLPLGLTIAGLWMAALYLSKIVIAAFLGRSLIAGNTGAPSVPLMLLAGLIPVFIAVNLPYVGSVIDFLLVVLGLGTLTVTIYQLTHRRNPSGSVAALAV